MQLLRPVCNFFEIETKVANTIKKEIAKFFQSSTLFSVGQGFKLFPKHFSPRNYSKLFSWGSFD